MNTTSHSTTLLTLTTAALACGGVEDIQAPGEEVSSGTLYAFALSASQAEVAAARAEEILENPAAFEAVLEQLEAPFECAKFGGLCEQVGEARAPRVIEEMVSMLLEGTPEDTLQDRFSTLIEEAMDESDRDEEAQDYVYDIGEKARFNTFFERHYGYAPETTPAPEVLGIQTRCSSRMESNTGKTFALVTWSYWSNGKNFKNSGCSGGKKKLQTSISGSMTHSCYDMKGGTLQDSQYLPKSKSSNTKKISLSWQPQWGATSCHNTYAWGATASSSGGTASTSDTRGF